MDGYISVNLNTAIKNDEIGEDRIKSVLSSFSCPINEDIENFIKYKAIDFSKNGWAQTHLIFTSYKEQFVLVGYYTLTIKDIVVYGESLSKTMKNRLKKFARYNADTKQYILAAPLIAQLGKNFNNHYNKLISGDELLKKALDKIKTLQMIAGGKFTYIECEDKEKILDFYSRNGFVKSGYRKLDKDETKDIKGLYLIQMIKYMHN